MGRLIDRPRLLDSVASTPFVYIYIYIHVRQRENKKPCSIPPLLSWDGMGWQGRVDNWGLEHRILPRRPREVAGSWGLGREVVEIKVWGE